METPNIITEFNTLIDNARSLRPKGWQFKVRNYEKVIHILKEVEKGENPWTMENIIEELRKGGMKFKGEQDNGPYKSQILIKIDKILNEGSLNITLDEKSQIIKELIRIPEIGPNKAEDLYKKGIRCLEDLEVQPELMNRKQKIGLRNYKDLEKRIPREEMDIWNESLGEWVQELFPVEGIELAGSYRRGKKDSGDIDLYVSVVERIKMSGLMDKIKNMLIERGILKENNIISCGDQKMMCLVQLPNEPIRHLDIFIYPSEEYAFALLFATGSGSFNIRMRNDALKKGYSLSDKGIRKGSNKGEWISKDDIHEKTGKESIHCEKDIFTFLGLKYISPENRTSTVLLEIF